MPLSRFDKLPEPKRQQILAAAAAEFSAHGFERASLNRVIGACSLSKGAMYYYFEDKHDLFATTLRAVLARARDAVTALPDEIADEEALWATVQAIYGDVIAFWASDPDAAALLQALMYHPGLLDGAGPVVDELRQLMLDVAAPLLQAASRLSLTPAPLDESLRREVVLGVVHAFDRWVVQQLAQRPLEAVRGEAPALLVETFKRLCRVES